MESVVFIDGENGPQLRKAVADERKIVFYRIPSGDANLTVPLSCILSSTIIKEEPSFIKAKYHPDTYRITLVTVKDNIVFYTFKRESDIKEFFTPKETIVEPTFTPIDPYTDYQSMMVFSSDKFIHSETMSDAIIHMKEIRECVTNSIESVKALFANRILMNTVLTTIDALIDSRETVLLPIILDVLRIGFTNGEMTQEVREFCSKNDNSYARMIMVSLSRAQEHRLVTSVIVAINRIYMLWPSSSVPVPERTFIIREFLILFQPGFVASVLRSLNEYITNKQYHDLKDALELLTTLSEMTTFNIVLPDLITDEIDDDGIKYACSLYINQIQKKSER